MENFYSDSTDRRIIPILRLGEVIDNTDSKNAGLIKARITGVDALESNQSLIECVPLIPKFLTSIPKVGESIFIFQYEDEKGPPTSKFNTKRFWIGPLISQPTKLEYEPTTESNAILPDGWTRLKDPDLEEGAYGNKEDIILQGRYNTDIIQKDRETWIRVGKFLNGANNEFNSKDLGYIQLKYGGDKLKRVLEDKEIVTQIYPTATIVIYAIITTYTTGNIILPGDIPEDKYKEANVIKTTINITVKNINDNSTINSLIQTFPEIPPIPGDPSTYPKVSRQNALNMARTFIDENKGDRWKIKSTANDLLHSYPNAKDGIAIFSITPTEDRKKIKQVKFVANDNTTSSVINIVANKINLLSHNGEHTFELANPKKLISDEEQEIINNESHPMVYGDTLVEFLELVKNFVNLHVHPYHGLSADNSDVKLDVLKFDLNTVLNKNINSN